MPVAATTASAVALKHGVALTGLGPAGKSASVPDVWIPDSSTWLLRLRSEASGFVPTDVQMHVFGLERVWAAGDVVEVDGKGHRSTPSVDVRRRLPSSSRVDKRVSLSP